MILFLFLVLLTSSNSEELYSNQQWISQQSLSIHFNVSEDCGKDMTAWFEHLAAFGGELAKCVGGGNCTQDQKKTMKNNLYALKQLDAFGKLPPGILDIKFTSYGSQEECKEVSKHFIYETNYCFVKSTLKGATCNSIHQKTAVCMPKSCSEEDITQIFIQLRHGILEPCSTVCIPEKGETNAFTWVFTSFMGLLLVICLIGSAIDYVLEHKYKKPSNSLTNPVLKAITAFSIFSNGAQILDTRPPRDGHLKSLDCIRFFSMLWVVSGHVTNFYVFNDALFPARHLPKPILNDTLLNAWFSVDTFFVLSGLLVSYMFFKMTAKNPRIVKKPVTWILFYVHRYLRLTPPYMLFICFYIVVVPLFTGVISTLWGFNANDVESCRKNWWQNLLYINNFNNKDHCYGMSWYLACDTQMYVAAPIVLVALFVNQYIGIATILAIGTGSVIASMVIIMKNHLPGVPTIPDPSAKFADYLYVKPWIRCTPYLLGMYTGYFLARNGHRRIRINPLISIAGWILAISLALAIIYGPHDYIDQKQHWSSFVCAFYYSFSRVGWGIFICWVVVANHFKWAGPISSFMCHPLWQPLGRLSYTAYLVHVFCVIYFWNLFDRPLHFTSLGEQFLTCTLPIAVMAYVLAFFWSCLCELPFMKLEKLLIESLSGNRRPSPGKEVQKERPVENWDAEENRNENERL